MHGRGVRLYAMQEDQQLWYLLGKARSVPTPPFFVGKVMRAIHEEKVPPSMWHTKFLRWLAPSAIAALFILSLSLSRPSAEIEPNNLTSFTTLDLVEILNPEDYQILTEAGWPYDNGFLSASL